MAESSAQGAARERHDPEEAKDIDALLRRLNLQGEELVGVKIGGERLNDLKEEVKWLAIGMVHT